MLQQAAIDIKQQLESQLTMMKSQYPNDKMFMQERSALVNFLLSTKLNELFYQKSSKFQTSLAQVGKSRFNKSWTRDKKRNPKTKGSRTAKPRLKTSV